MFCHWGRKHSDAHSNPAEYIVLEVDSAQFVLRIHETQNESSTIVPTASRSFGKHRTSACEGASGPAAVLSRHIEELRVERGSERWHHQQQRTTSSPTALPKSLLHHSGSQCTISCSTFELQFIYLTIKDRGCKPLYNSITTAVSQLHQPGDISVRWLYTLLVKQQQLPDTYYVTVLRFSAGVRILGIL